MFLTPWTLLLLVGLVLATLFLFVLVQLKVIALSFRLAGIPDGAVFAVLFATLAGSLFNIPLARIPQQDVIQHQVVRLFGRRYVVPTWDRPYTLVSANVGGAVIPTLVSCYLFLRTASPVAMLLATAAMAFVTWKIARPLPGIGIVLPALVPALGAALMAVLFAREQAPMVAYVAGSMGTLIGADLLHLNRVRDLRAPVVSIGGAGTFDGIFISGILGVLLAAILTS